MTSTGASSYEAKLKVTKTVLWILFVITALGVAFLFYIAPAFVGGFEITETFTILSAIPQILTPLFILMILLLSEWQRKKGHYMTAWNINLFGLIGTVISITSILL